jgi:hypothetical protein
VAGPTLKDALFDYWRWGLSSESPQELTRECELIEKLVLPVFGRVSVEAIGSDHRHALALMLRSNGVDDFTIRRALEALSSICFFFETDPSRTA